ncbi:MAG: NYN domain-containing protein [Lachnospiraceae bacterium]|nr:NYN domain-containing protein [Lachnospiraceae bacterium]
MNNRIAVLIDAENTSVKYVDVALKELKQYGDISVQRMYGDFSSSSMAEWSKKALEYAIVPIHQARYTASKNASDIMLVIDAMDILFRDSAEIFCLISSDSDFTRLASRLREGGKKVIGMGKSDASKSFITACNEYKFLDKISEEDNDDEDDNNTELSAITPISDIKKAINYMIQQAESSGELLNLGSSKSRLQREFADFDERNYGYTLFRKFIEEETRFAVEISGSTAYITRKGQDKKQDDTDKVAGYITERAKKKVELAALGHELHDRFPNFKYKDLGYAKLSKYVESIAGVRITSRGNKKIVESK